MPVMGIEPNDQTAYDCESSVLTTMLEKILLFTASYDKYMLGQSFTEQWGLIQIFRNHEIFRKKIRMHFEQAIIHLSKSLNLILIKCLQIT